MRHLFLFILVALTCSSFGQGIEYNSKINAQHIFKEKLDSTICYGFNSSANEWMRVYKSIFLFDENGKRTTDIISQLNKYPVEEVFKLETTYHEDGTENETYYYEKVGVNWFAYTKFTHTYNSGRLLTEKTEYRLDDNKKWEFYRKYTYEYDQNGRKIKEIAEGEVITFTYDSNGRLILQQVGSSPITYQYDSYGNCIKQEGNDELGKNSTFIYDLETNFFDVKNTPFVIVGSGAYFQISQINKLIEITSPSINVKFHYSPIGVNSLKKPESNQVIISPTTVKDNFAINGNIGDVKIELISIQGQKVFSKNIEFQESVNISHLSRGIYLYNIYIDGSKHCGKLIKD